MSVVLFNYQSFHHCHAFLYSVSGALFDSTVSVNEATPVSVIPFLVANAEKFQCFVFESIKYSL